MDAERPRLASRWDADRQILFVTPSPMHESGSAEPTMICVINLRRTRPRTRRAAHGIAELVFPRSFRLQRPEPFRRICALGSAHERADETQRSDDHEQRR